MRSRLDLIFPENTKPKFDLNSHKKCRKLDVGDLVQCRNFGGKVKWEKGHIIKCLGKLHYLIRLDDGREWKWHINQIRSTKNAGCSIACIPREREDILNSNVRGPVEDS
jgi:hypothetical protein